MISELKACDVSRISLTPPLMVDVSADQFTREDAVPGGALGQGQTISHRNGDSARPKVLVVDDEHMIANTLAIILNASGFEARAVYSGEEALQALGSFQPDVLISDVFMTGISGVEAAIAFRMQCPNCKILLFSGQAATADLLLHARQQGHDFEIMAKPVHPSDLLAKLRTGCAALNNSFDS